MNNEEKFHFTVKILTLEAQNYMNSPIEYDSYVEYWLDTMISNTQPEERIKSNLESAYRAALNLYDRRKNDYDQIIDFISK